jgi:signal transduction histidine kinase
MYAAMALLTHYGVLPFVPPPSMAMGGASPGYIVAAVFYAALVVGVPTFFTAAILKILREKERALEARTHELIEAQRLRSQLMANVTHELRTPIQGVMGLGDLVASGIYGPVTEQQKEALVGVKRSAKSLLGLIDDLLELSRAEAGRQAFRPSMVDLSDVLPTVVASARWMAGTKPLTIELELEPDLPEVVSDRGKLNQIVINLLANAVKFTPDGGTIRVSAHRDRERVAIEVTDSGIGIAEEDREKIFEAFRQLDGSPERLYGGVGLGLTVVRHLAGMIGAEVTVASDLGKGSTFTVRL